VRKEIDGGVPPYGPKVPYSWRIRIDTLSLRIRNLASIVDPADDRMPDTENSYEAAYN
jgi:hypothetical protein